MALSLDGVTKKFQDGSGGIVAVDDVSINIADGEFLVLVGPSGCGKSTTLQMVAGLEQPTEGTISINGENVNGVGPQKRNIAMVFQSYALYPHMTVRGNMSFGLEESTDLKQDEINGRVERSAEMMGISELLDRKPEELSGGQQQRVALGRAIVRDPQAFLLDEPLSNLDAKLRSQMRTELQRLQADLDVTTVYVTHDQTEAMTMGDRIAILNDGLLQQVATPLEAYHSPVNQFVAGFLGEPSMNFFDMEVQGDQLVGDSFTYPLTPEMQESVRNAAHVTLGIRPEDVLIVPAVQEDFDFDTVVDVVEPKGSENVVYLDFPQSDDDRGTLDAVVGGMQAPEVGQPAVARIPQMAVHLFETDSGQAIHNRSLEDVEEPEVRP